jgi:hypothetical protein
MFNQIDEQQCISPSAIGEFDRPHCEGLGHESGLRGQHLAPS